MPQASVLMRVMHVGDMRMTMTQPLVAMQMRMRFARRIAGSMRVLMMLVMHMTMAVRHRLVHMLMIVPLG
jgi:hypothetical protein